MTEQTAIANYLKYTGNKTIELTTALVDMDGVLFDSMKNHTRAWVKLMKKNGIKCTRDEFYLYEGMTGIDTIKKKFKDGASKNITDDEAAGLYKVKTRYFSELGEVEVIKGTADVLALLKNSGIKCVLVTGSGQQSLLDRIDTDYAGIFEQERVTAADVKHGKPNPEAYLKGMAKAGAKANQCLVIENAPLGVQAGHVAGCFTVGVTTGPISEKELYKAGADIVFKSMEDFAMGLPKLLESLKSPVQ